MSQASKNSYKYTITKKDTVFLIISLIAVAAVALYIVKNAAAFKKIIIINPWDAVPFVLLQIALLATNAFALSSYLEIFKSKISFLDSFGLNVLNTFFNNIFIKGGPLIKGYYLKRMHKLSFTDFILIIASFTLIEVMVGGFLGIYALLVIYLKKGFLNYFLLLFFVLILLVCYAVIRAPLHRIFKKKEIWLIKKLFDVAISWQKIAADRAIMIKLFILAFLNFFIFALRMQYGFKVLYRSVAFIDCLLISAVATIGSILGITPGALGVREFLTGATYKLINGNMLEAVVVTVLDRAVSTIAIFILGGCFILYFINKTKEKVMKEGISGA